MKTAKINRVGESFTRTLQSRDYSWVFSDDIQKWIGSADREKHNKRAAVYNTKYREEKRAKRN